MVRLYIKSATCFLILVGCMMSLTSAQERFITRKPFGFGNTYPVNSYVDHVRNGVETLNRFDGADISSAGNCTLGYNCYEDHRGTDYNMAAGTDIICPADGEVSISGTEACSWSTNTVIKIDHGNGYHSIFYHLDVGNDPSDDLPWAVGDEISTGDVVGTVGNHGCSNGAHMHWELADDNDTRWDPYGSWRGGGYHSFFSGGTVIDLENVGFQRFTLYNWFDQAGSEEATIFTYGSHDGNSSTYENFAQWTANILRTGYYRVEAYVPSDPDGATDVVYKIKHRDGITSAVRSHQNRGEWVPVGNFYFEEGDRAEVILTDNVYYSSDQGKKIFFSTMRWTNLDGSLTSSGSGANRTLACANYSNLSATINNGQYEVYHAPSSITTGSFVVKAGGTAQLHGKDYVVLKNGFHSKSGSTLGIFSQGCAATTAARIANPNDDSQTLLPEVLEEAKSKKLILAPNPANDRLMISIFFKKKEKVSIDLYSIHGKLIRNLTKDTEAEDEYKLKVSIDDIVPGIYLVTAKGNGWTSSQKLVVSD